MRVLAITNYLGNFGGLGRYSKEVLKAQRAQGLDVCVLTEAKEATVSYEYPVLKKVFNKQKYQVVLNVMFNLYQTRKYAASFDVVHAHDGWPYALYGYVAVLGTQKRLYITGIGTYTIAPLTSKVTGFFLRKAYRRASMIFCISEYVTKRLTELVSGIHARTVYMGTTNLPEITPDQIDQYKTTYHISDQTPIFLTVGDIKHRKGQLDTLKALLLLKNKYPHFLYVLIGTDEDTYYVGKIRELVKKHNLEKNVLIISDVYDDTVLSFFYTISDIFLLNSNNEGNHFEGFGLVLLEAAQFGKPVIGSRGCGIESALKDGYDGFLVKQGDHEDIVVKVKDIVSNHMKDFSENSKNFYKNFSWEKTAKEYIQAYLT